MAYTLKNLCLPGAIALLAFATGCASSQPHSDAPDGIFTTSNNDALSYEMTVFPPNGGPGRTATIQDYGGFLPRHITIVDRPQACLIQISGEGIARDWADQPLFVVANHVPYWQLKISAEKAAVPGKSQASPATIFVIMANRKGADKVAAALCKRYHLPPPEKPMPEM